MEEEKQIIDDISVPENIPSDAIQITQEQVDNKVKEIYDKIENYFEFIMANYTILSKKPVLTGELLLIMKQSKHQYRYQSMEMIKYYAEVVAFYMALEELGLPYEQW